MLMLISRNLMLSVIFFVVVVFVAVLAYLCIRSYLTNKRVKEAERAHELLFLAKVQAQRKEKESAEKGVASGSIAYKPDSHISDFSQRPFAIKHADIPDTVTQTTEDYPQISEEPVTRKLSEFFE